jgi:hypothetical protein
MNTSNPDKVGLNPSPPKGGFSTPSLVDQNVDLCYHAAGDCASDGSFPQL